MKIQLHTDRNIQHDESLTEHVDSVVSKALERFGAQVSRVEVHLRDLNAGKAGIGDKHCVMEARLEGRQPVVVSHDADKVREAVNGAAQKLQRLLDSALGRLAAPVRQGRTGASAAPDEPQISFDPAADLS
ncbi:MAG TPA: HPF/RaiA family ribosome-associated protein [Lysobacter sp.]|nr:HPF/RaiA family ribosome-associated protein [Lysobacter sp.]